MARRCSYLDRSSTSPAAPTEGVSGSHSALPLRPGVLSSLLSYWALTTWHVTYLPERDANRSGPPTSSRHYGVGPTTTVRADNPCHGASAVPECPRALLVTAGSDGLGGSLGLTTFESTPADPVTWIRCETHSHASRSLRTLRDHGRRAIPLSGGKFPLLLRVLRAVRHEVVVVDSSPTACLYKDVVILATATDQSVSLSLHKTASG